MGQSDSDSPISIWTFDTPSNDLLFGLVGWQHGSGNGESSAQKSIIFRTEVIIGARLVMKNHGFPAIGGGVLRAGGLLPRPRGFQTGG